MTINLPINNTYKKFKSPRVIHQNKDGKWYFWDEIWSYEYGPYDTHKECAKALRNYCDRYLFSTKGASNAKLSKV